MTGTSSSGVDGDTDEAVNGARPAGAISQPCALRLEPATDIGWLPQGRAGRVAKGPGRAPAATPGHPLPQNPAGHPESEVPTRMRTHQRAERRMREHALSHAARCDQRDRASAHEGDVRPCARSGGPPDDCRCGWCRRAGTAARPRRARHTGGSTKSRAPSNRQPRAEKVGVTRMHRQTLPPETRQPIWHHQNQRPATNHHHHGRDSPGQVRS